MLCGLLPEQPAAAPRPVDLQAVVTGAGACDARLSMGESTGQKAAEEEQELRHLRQQDRVQRVADPCKHNGQHLMGCI